MRKAFAGALLLFVAMMVARAQAITSNVGGSCSGPTNSFTCNLPTSEGKAHVEFYADYNYQTHTSISGWILLPDGTKFTDVVWTQNPQMIDCGDHTQLVGTFNHGVDSTSQTIQSVSGMRGGCSIKNQGGTTTLY